DPVRRWRRVRDGRRDRHLDPTAAAARAGRRRRADHLQIPRPRQRPGAPLNSSPSAKTAPLHPSGGRGRGPLRKRREGEVGVGYAPRGSLHAGSGRRIGLLGGSFNPAHGGHVHVSRLALQRLRLDEVWWLVSPQNPLKPPAGMAPFTDRFAQARKAAAGERRIRVTRIEAELGSTYTADTLKALRRRFPHARFVWLMGGDNLAQLPYWRQWQDIFRTVPIAVFARPGASLKALAGMPAQRFARWRIPATAARRLAAIPPPAWVFFHTRLDPRSATAIRGERLLPTRKETTPAVTAEPTAIATLTPRSRQASRAPDLLRHIIDSLED